MFSVTWHFPSDDSTTRYVYCVCVCVYVSVRKSSIQVLSVSPSCLVWCSHIPNHWHPFDFHTGLCLNFFFFLWLFKCIVFFSYFSGGFFYLFVPLTSFYTAWANYLIWRLQQKDQSITKVQKWSVIQSRHGHTGCAFQGQILSLKYPNNIFLSVKNILSLPERSFWDKGRLFPHQTGVGTQHHLVIYYKVNTCTSTVCIISPYNSPLSLLFLHV